MLNTALAFVTHQVGGGEKFFSPIQGPNMKNILHRLNKFFEGIPERVGQRKIFIWALFFLITLPIGYGAGRVEIDMTMDAFFLPGDPVKALNDRFKDTFGSDEGVYIVYEARDGDIFSDASLKAVEGIQKELLRVSGRLDAGEAHPLDHIQEVETIVNADYLEGRDDTLSSGEFMGGGLPSSNAERETLRRKALAHRDYPLFYLSNDSRYGGIFIRTDFGAIPEDLPAGEGEEVLAFSDPGEEKASGAETGEDLTIVRYKATSMEEYALFTRELNKIIEQPQYGDALTLYPVGNPILMAFFLDVLNVEIEMLLLGAMLIMMVVLWVLFRSLSAVVWPISIVIVSVVLTLGVMGWVGMKMSMMISVLMLLLLVVGIADAVHILSGYLYFRRTGMEHPEAMRAVFAKSGVACMLTSLTTAAGMLSLLIVPIGPIRNFGVAAALGVTIAFGMTIVILPLMMSIWRPASRAPAKAGAEAQGPALGIPWAQRFLEMMEPLVHRYPLRIAVLFLLVAIGSVYGMTRVQVDSNVVQIIKKGHPMRDAYEIVDEKMGGSQNMEIFLEFGRMDALKDPRVLTMMEEIQRWLKEDYGKFVVKSDSLVNVVKNSFQVLNEGREEMHRIPEQRAMLAQTLLLYETADPETRAQLVSDDFSQGRIAVRLFNYGSMEYLEFFTEVETRLEKAVASLRDAYPEARVGVTGSLAIMMRVADFLSWSQIQSFALVLVVITVILLAVFGSLRTGLIALVPNVFPVLVTFGAMGLLGLPLDADTLIIAPVIIGIAVDDTIHFITHFRSLYLESGSVVDSVTASIKEVGQAITFTSLILILGFLILIPSNHQGIANFGLLTALAFLAALLADLLLLPSLLLLLYKGSARPAAG